VQRVLSDTLWRELRKLASRRTEKQAAVGFVSSDELIKFGRGDVLIVDASDQVIGSGLTSASVLKRALKRGALLYSCPGLHAKLFVFDSVAVIGSSNISVSSSSSLIEIGLLTDDAATVSTGKATIEKLTDFAVEIDQAFIRRAETIPVRRRGWSPGMRSRPMLLAGRAPVTWMVSITPLDEDRFASETDDIRTGETVATKRKSSARKEISWIRWTGRSRFRTLSKEGDSVIQIWKPARGRRPTTVYAHGPILLKQSESRCTRFYIEDPKAGSELTWPEFLRVARKVGLTIGPSLTRAIADDQSDALRALWGRGRSG
jgi:phosphatidylserine/phosphatidylglycerophosphate/cardiolipin synthase-like enzyme